MNSAFWHRNCFVKLNNEKENSHFDSIPDREPVSRIRLDLKNETAERLKENPEFAALVSSDPITAAIERYNAAAEGVRRIYEEYNGIKSLFSSAIRFRVKAVLESHVLIFL